MSNLMANIRNEYRVSTSFKMATIGAILSVLSVIIVFIAASMKLKSKSIVLPMLLNLLFVILFSALGMYATYCILNGKCEFLAAFEGSMMLILGILSFIVAILVPFGKTTEEFAAARRR